MYSWDAGNHHPESVEPVPLDNLQVCIETAANGVQGWEPKPWSGLRFVSIFKFMYNFNYVFSL